MAGILEFIPLVFWTFLMICTIIQIGLSSFLLSQAGPEPFPIFIEILACSIVIALTLAGALALPGIRPMKFAPKKIALLFNIPLILIILGLSALNVAWFGIEYSRGWSDTWFCDRFDPPGTCAPEKAMKGFTVSSLVFAVFLTAYFVVNVVRGLRMSAGKTVSEV